MKPFKLHTDACIFGLGVVLYQNENRINKVISYASMVLSKIMCKNQAHKLEFLALKWTITEQYHEYPMVILP